MAIEKQLGKIKKASYGFGGYQDAQIGLSFDLGGDGWGVGDFWTDYGGFSEKVHKLLTEAKVQTVAQLVGVPIEVTFDNGVRKDWRVLTEVL